MITATVEYVFVDANPFISIGALDTMSDEYRELPKPFQAALFDVYEHQDNATCARCDDPVGFVLREQPSGFERLEWTPTGLAREGDGPVAVLCEECTPFIPTPKDAQEAQR